MQQDMWGAPLTGPVLPDPRWRRWALLLPLVLLALCSLLLLVPDRAKLTLVGPEGWHLSADGFVPGEGNGRELPLSLLHQPGVRFWSSWTPEGRRQGTLQTDAFVLPKRGFALPVRGFPGAQGNLIEVECVATGERLPFAHARTNTDWALAKFQPDGGWCRQGDGQVVLHVAAASTTHEIAIGTPFKINWTFHLKTSTLQAGANLMLGWALLVGAFWLVLQRLSAVLDMRIRAATALAVMGGVGYCAFFVFAASVPWGSGLTVLVAGAGALGFLRFVASGTLRTRDELAVWSACWLWLAVGLLVVAVFGLAEVNAGPWSPNSRFWPAGWSSDNQLPIRIGQMTASGHLADTAWMGPWHVSDRPPLAYGWHAMFNKLFGSSWVPSDGVYLMPQHGWPVGILLNTFWAPVLFLILLRGGMGTRLAFATLVAALLSPFLLFNSGYIWPKLLSGALGLAAAYLLFDAGSSLRRPLREDTAGFLLAAVLSALALQAHGGAAFAILAMLVMAPLFRGLPRWRDMAIAAVICLAILGPWIVYQRWIDPPGNALLKYAFAGTFGFGEEHIGVLETIQRTYANTSLAGWLQSKWTALGALVVGTGQCGLSEHGPVVTLFDRFRSRDFFFVLPALSLLAGLALVARILPRTAPAASFAAGTWLAWGVLSIGVAALLTLDCNINHTQSYAAMLALHLGLLLAMARNTQVLVAGLAVVMAYGVVVWILDPLRYFAQWDATALLVGAVAVLVTPLVLLPLRSAIEPKSARD